VVDTFGRDLVGIEEQRSDRQSGRIGARTLFPATRWRIYSMKIPYNYAHCCEGGVGVIGVVKLIEFAFGTVYHDQVTIVIGSGTMIISLTFNTAALG
jgi:hypothetical protein